MSTTSSRKSKRRDPAPQVPRDPDVGKADAGGREPKSAADVNPRDEYYTDLDKPLVAGSKPARVLHDNPGKLGVGTAGDAARATKPGVHNKPIPPRGSL